MGPYQRTPEQVARAIRYSGLGVCSVGPVGGFLEKLYTGGKKNPTAFCCTQLMGSCGQNLSSNTFVFLGGKNGGNL